MRSRVRILAFVFIAAAAAIARAEKPAYLDPAAVDPAKLLPGPPSAASTEARAELELMLSIQDKRSQADVDRCASEVKLGVEAFQSVLGPWCTTKNLPRLAKLFADLDRDSKSITNAAKDHFRRPRPEHDEPRIHVPIADDTTFAYPSGHATRGIMYAWILAELAPEHRDALLDRGREIGWDRVVAGLHHPSDIMAGRVLGQALSQTLLADPRFQSQLVELKTELHDAQQHAAEPAGRR
jgi:acid phosphatase (class A)